MRLISFKRKLKRVSLINKCKKVEMVMEKLLCCRYFGESACKRVFSVNQVKRLGRHGGEECVGGE